MTDAERVIEQLKRYQRLDNRGHQDLCEYLDLIYNAANQNQRDIIEKNGFIDGLRQENHELKQKLQTALDLLNHKSEVER